MLDSGSALLKPMHRMGALQWTCRSSIIDTKHLLCESWQHLQVITAWNSDFMHRYVHEVNRTIYMVMQRGMFMSSIPTSTISHTGGNGHMWELRKKAPSRCGRLSSGLYVTGTSSKQC